MMKINKLCVVMVVALSLVAFGLSGCSSGGGGGSTPVVNNPGTGGNDPTTSAATAMVVANKVTVVDAKLSGTVAAVKPLRMGAIRLAPPAGSDYDTDETQVWVHERSVEGFNIVNEILCAIAQTKYDEMLNKGAYLALVDTSQCSTDRSDASQGSQSSEEQSSSETTMPTYEKWSVDVTRADGSSPQYIKAWIHEEAREGDMEQPQLITAKVEITEGKSATNPNGIFTINFAAYPIIQSTGAVGAHIAFKGYLKSEKDSAGKILLKFVNETTGGPGAVFGFKQAVTLDRGGDDTGKGTVYEFFSDTSQSFSEEHNFNIAYNADFFLRNDGQQSICLSRNEFDQSAWRYGLYDSTTGARLNRNSGFSINTAADGSGAHGWVGYWGVWIDNDSALPATVYKFDYSTRTSSPYAVLSAPGKLKKHSRGNLTIGEIAGIPLDYNVWDQNTNQGTNYRVIWNGSAFMKTARMECSQNGPCNWTKIEPAVAIDTTHLQWSELNFWSQSLGGQVRVPLGTVSSPCSFETSTNGPGYSNCPAPTSATKVVFFKEDIVYPTETIPASLVCFDNCPKATASGVNADDPSYMNWDPSTGQSIQRTYSFDSAAMVLNDTNNGSFPVVMTTTSEQNQWGVHTGPLFADTPANMDLLKCDWPNQQGVYETCGWKAWSVLDVFYTWETGPNNWNKFTGLKDPATGQFLTFEPPLQVKYVHQETGSPFNNATFFLEYAGFGDLHGIPGKCVNIETGGEVECGEGGPGSPIRWVPAYTISTGSTVADGSTNYLVKPLEMEQRMKKNDTGGCSTLSATPYALPTISDWVDPAIGTAPTITAAPAVIGGEVQ